MARRHHSPYSAEFKEQALTKVRQRGMRTLESVANELSLPLATLKQWLKKPKEKKGSAQAAGPLPLGGPACVWGRRGGYSFALACLVQALYSVLLSNVSTLDGGRPGPVERSLAGR
jgi:hypothetical protein